MLRIVDPDIMQESFWQIENNTFNTLKNQDYHFHITLAMAIRTFALSLRDADDALTNSNGCILF